MPKVYVLNRHGRPLMPCTPAKARHLLDAGKAKVRHRTPFTIQLLYGSTGYTQEVILGVDAGSKTIGLSAATETEELFSAEVKPRNDVVELMSARRQFRRARRNRTPGIASHASTIACGASTKAGLRPPWRSRFRST